VSGSARSGLGRLTAVELRKLADTRSGRSLLGIIAVLTLAVVVLGVLAPGEPDRTFVPLFQLTLLPTGVILPVLGILTVTSEWSQRTALTTFVLVPHRHRVMAAKLLAAVTYALASVVVGLATAALGTLAAAALDRGDGSWDASIGLLGYAALFQVINVVMGIAFGMLLLNSPLAIVLYFALPVLWTTVVTLVPRISGTAAWFDLNLQLEPLAEDAMRSGDWPRLAVAVATWVLLPLAAGVVRVVRGELR